MSKYIVKILKTEFVTHTVKRFVVEKPTGYNFISGQATDVSINKPAIEEELRPFTFTSVNEADYLEFIIKIYSDHEGITNKLGMLNAGEELILHDVFGTITYQGPGLFIAGGAGITPFISILRQLKLDNKLSGNTLLFANRTVDDVILHDELQELLSERLISVVERSEDPSAPPRFIDQELIKRYLDDQTQYYYVCGPDAFVSLMVNYLLDLGIDESKVIIEQ